MSCFGRILLIVVRDQEVTRGVGLAGRALAAAPLIVMIPVNPDGTTSVGCDTAIDREDCKGCVII